MGSVSIVNVFLKIRELSEITTEELQKALDSLNVKPEFYIYKILFEFHYGLVSTEYVSNDYRLDYYKNIVSKFIDLYPEVYSSDDLELYSKFALVIYMYNFDKGKYIELDVLNEVLELLDDDIESGSLKWVIREMTKTYILRYYMYHKEYHHLMKPLIDELLITEDELIALLDNLDGLD